MINPRCRSRSVLQPFFLWVSSSGKCSSSARLPRALPCPSGGSTEGGEKSLQRGADSSPPAPSRGAVPADGSGVPSPVSFTPKCGRGCKRRRVLQAAGRCLSRCSSRASSLPAPRCRAQQTLGPGRELPGGNRGSGGESRDGSGRLALPESTPGCCGCPRQARGASPRGVMEPGAGQRGRRVPPGLPGALAELGDPGGCGHSPRSGQFWRPLALGFTRASPTLRGAWGPPARLGHAAPWWGSWQSPPLAPPPPARGCDPRGAGGGREEAAASWARRRLQRRPRKPERNEVAPGQVPTAAPVKKIHPELVAVAAVTGRVLCHGGGHGRTQVCTTGTPMWAAKGWAVELGTGGDQRLLPCLLLPPPALMCRDFALGKAGRLLSSSRLQPNEVPAPPRSWHPALPSGASTEPVSPQPPHHPLHHGATLASIPEPPAPLQAVGRKRPQLPVPVGLFLAGLAPAGARGGEGKPGGAGEAALRNAPAPRFHPHCLKGRLCAGAAAPRPGINSRD